MIPYEDCKVTGPHFRKDFYRVMEIVKPNGKRTTVSYHRYLMELHLGRYLNKNEVVHHIDGDNTNNSLTNLKVLSPTEHGELHHGKGEVEYTCPVCKVKFILKGRKLTSRKQGELRGIADGGPFCSKSCSNKYTGTKNPVTFKCTFCGVAFTLSGRKLSCFIYYNKKVDRKPFCSRICALAHKRCS